MNFINTYNNDSRNNGITLLFNNWVKRKIISETNIIDGHLHELRLNINNNILAIVSIYMSWNKNFLSKE